MAPRVDDDIASPQLHRPAAIDSSPAGPFDHHVEREHIAGVASESGRQVGADRDADWRPRAGRTHPVIQRTGQPDPAQHVGRQVSGAPGRTVIKFGRLVISTPRILA